MKYPEKVERRPDRIAAVRYPEKVGCRPDRIAVVRHPDKVERWSDSDVRYPEKVESWLDPDVRYPEKVERRPDSDVRCPGGMNENFRPGGMSDATCRKGDVCVAKGKEATRHFLGRIPQTPFKKRLRIILMGGTEELGIHQAVERTPKCVL